tara:strand:+ start:3177 stop:5396 length:2220 start_codon:yes stop_codon:yes gene_type:complete
MGASSSRSSVPRWNTLHERGQGKEEADVRGKETEENEDVEKGLCGCKKKKKTNAKYGSNHTNTIQSKEKTKKKKEENYDAIIGDENDEDRRRRSRYDGRSSQSVSSEDEDEVAKRLQYESLSAKTKKGTHGSKESSVKSSEKSSKKQLRKEKEQLAMNAKLYDLEKQEILATRKKLADEEELEKGRRMWLCSGSPWVSRVAVCVLLVLVVVLATILGTELHYYERGLAYFRGEEYIPPMAYDGGRSRRKKKNSRIDDEVEDEDDVELGEDEEEEDDSEFDENFDKDGGAGAALSVNEREIKMAKKLMQKVRNSKTLPKDRKQVELRGLNETLTNLQIERVELLNEFDDSDDAKSSSSVAKVGLSGEMAKKIANKNRILENNDRDKTGAYYNANAPFRYPWGGTSPGTSHSDESSSSSKKGGLTEDVSEQDILRGQHFDADLRGNAMSREEVKLSVSDFIARLKEKEGVKGWSKNVRDTVASDDFAHRIARSMVNDVRGVSDDEDILWSHADDVALPENSDITEDDVLSRLELEKKLNAVEQSLAEEKGKDEWLARTAAKNSVDKFLNEADLRGRIESGEVDPEVLENLIEAVQQSEKSNIDTVNTVENDVMKKLHPAKKAKKKSSANKKNSDADDVQEEGEKPKESHPMSLDDLFDIPTDGLDTGDDDDDNETGTKKSKKKSIISSKNRSTSSSSSSSKKNAKKSSGGDMKKAKKGKEEEKVDSPSPPEDGKKGLLDEI